VQSTILCFQTNSRFHYHTIVIAWLGGEQGKDLRSSSQVQNTNRTSSAPHIFFIKTGASTQG